MKRTDPPLFRIETADASRLCEWKHHSYTRESAPARQEDIAAQVLGINVSWAGTTHAGGVLTMRFKDRAVRIRPVAAWEYGPARGKKTF